MQFVFIGGRAATIEYQGGVDAGPSGASPSATAVPYGAADTQRRVIQIVHWFGNVTLSAATIGGVAAAIHVQNKEALVGLSTGGIAIISAEPSGTSGTTALTFSGGAGDGTRVESFRAVGIVNTTPVTATANLGLSAGNSKTIEIDVQANGFVMAGLTGKFGGGSVTTTGLTERYEVVKFSDFPEVGGCDNIATTEASKDITFSASFEGAAIVAAAFR